MNEHKKSLNWLNVLDHPYRNFIFGRSGSGKKKDLLNLINHQSHIDQSDNHQKILVNQKTNY